MGANHLVSIIIPVFNRADLIPETLESVIAQTYSNWECLVVDDGSTDGTREVVQGFCERDSRIKLFSRPSDRPKGANACRNYGLEVACGEFVKFFDDDDLMDREMLANQVEVLEKNPGVDAVACRWRLFVGDALHRQFAEDLTIKRPRSLSLQSYLFGEFYLSMLAPLWRRDSIYKPKAFDESLTRLQDMDFHLTQLLNGATILGHDDVLFSVRRGHDSITENRSLSSEAQRSSIKYWLRVFSETHRLENQEEAQVRILSTIIGHYRKFCGLVGISFRARCPFGLVLGASIRARVDLTSKLKNLAVILMIAALGGRLDSVLAWRRKITRRI